MDIFFRNIGTLSQEEQSALSSKKVFVAGCGGLGGYVAEFLTRAGIGSLVICDMDVFEETNLNRQRFSDLKQLGMNKAEVAAKKLSEISPILSVKAINEKITLDNAEKLISDCDLVIDALDNIATRLILENAAETKNVPLIFGAVSGWCGQVSTVMPFDKTITALYAQSSEVKAPSVLVATVAVTAGYQVAEAIKTLLGRPTLSGKLLVIDLSDNSLDILTMK